MQLSLDPALLLGIGVIAVVVFLVLGFFVAPRRYVRNLPDLGPRPEDDRIPLKDQVTIRADQEKRRNDLRTGALQAIGGLALIFALLTTLLQLQANQKQATEQQDLTRRGQIADRFTKAIDQLGNQNNLDVRLGGIYGLEQIARDSRDDRTRLATYEVLTAFVREHANWNPSTSPAFAGLPELQLRAADIQAAVAVLGRREVLNGDPPIDLHGVDLRLARLSAAHLERAFLIAAHLEGAALLGTHMDRADLGAVHAERAALTFAYLGSAYLGGAHLEDADLRFARLEGAFVVGAHLERANLIGARLGGGTLQSDSLRQASLAGAVADKNTIWPAGFDWKAAGVRVVG